MTDGLDKSEPHPINNVRIRAKLETERFEYMKDFLDRMETNSREEWELLFGFGLHMTDWALRFMNREVKTDPTIAYPETLAVIESENRAFREVFQSIMQTPKDQIPDWLNLSLASSKPIWGPTPPEFTNFTKGFLSCFAAIRANLEDSKNPSPNPTKEPRS